MKVRKCFVSNSSSSSFIISYDPIFFGNIQAFIEEYMPGCETAVYDLNILNEDMPELKDIVESERNNGNQIAYFSLDQEYFLIIDLLKMINESNGGDKMKLLYGDTDL